MKNPAGFPNLLRDIMLSAKREVESPEEFEFEAVEIEPLILSGFPNLDKYHHVVKIGGPVGWDSDFWKLH